MYKILHLLAELNLQLSEFELRKKIKLKLKYHVLNKPVKIFDISTNLGNFISIVKHINRNFYKRDSIYQ